jgi:hypothetical protein
MSEFPLKRREFLVGAGVSGLGLVFGLDLKPAAASVAEIETGAGSTWRRVARVLNDFELGCPVLHFLEGRGF